ncbi:unnamed protein product [Amoebophrya sp. A25]|nr:unnamed protein product [Amoebophrya sp. A25]|eukprot:GSA25T00025763001.1
MSRRSGSRSRSPARDRKPAGYRGHPSNSEEMSRTLFVANISDEADEHDVQKLFTGFGFDLTEVSLPRHASDRNHRGYGFVHLADARDVNDAVSKANQHDFFGRPLKVEVKNPRPGPPRSKGGGKGRRDSRGRGRGDSRGRGRGGGRRDSRRRDSRRRR